jgi:hypothetical protein
MSHHPLAFTNLAPSEFAANIPCIPDQQSDGIRNFPVFSATMIQTDRFSKNSPATLSTCFLKPMKTVLSFGMGVESSSLIVFWCENRSRLDFDLTEDLVVVTAMTGDEFPDQKLLVERHILPRLRAHRIRYVQVARAGHLESDGIVVLDDTREPYTVYLSGAYKLSQELRAAGTVPQFAGEHRCSLKSKKFPIERWIEGELGGEHYRHAFGYNADERRRIEKSESAFAEREPMRVAFGFNAEEGARISKARNYDTPLRLGWYPLAEELGWNRADCARYLKEITGETWERSCCLYCPFSKPTPEVIARQRKFPLQLAEALALEHQSLALNPRGSLYRGRTLYSVVVEDGNAIALAMFGEMLRTGEHALYRVRRIYKAPGKADRAVERLTTGTRAEMFTRFASATVGLRVRVEHGISYGYVREREIDLYPTVEEFYVVAPATVESKTRYGFDWFEAKWRETLGETGQGRLFD